MNKKLVSLTFLLGLALFISTACRLVTGSATTPSTSIDAATPAQPTSHAPATSMDGKALLEERCNACHSLSYINNSRGTPDQWAAVVSAMVANGAVLNSQEEKALVEYLATNFAQ
jgi:cytochrome c5